METKKSAIIIQLKQDGPSYTLTSSLAEEIVAIIAEKKHKLKKQIILAMMLIVAMFLSHGYMGIH